MFGLTEMIAAHSDKDKDEVGLWQHHEKFGRL